MPKSIQLNPKAEAVVAPRCSMLLHGILIGDTNWAGPSFPSILCCIPGTSSWDMLQTTAEPPGGDSDFM